MDRIRNVFNVGYASIPGFESSGQRTQATRGALGLANRRTAGFASTLRKAFKFKGRKDGYGRLTQQDTRQPVPARNNRRSLTPLKAMPAQSSGSQDRKAVFERDQAGKQILTTLRELTVQAKSLRADDKKGPDSKSPSGLPTIESINEKWTAQSKLALQREFPVLREPGAFFDDKKLARLASKLADLDHQLACVAAPEYNSNLLLTTLAAQGRVRGMFESATPASGDSTERTGGTAGLALEDKGDSRSHRTQEDAFPRAKMTARQQTVESACDALEGLLDQMLDSLKDGHDGHALCCLSGQSTILDGAITNLREKAVAAAIAGVPIADLKGPPSKDVKNFVANEMASVAARTHLQQALAHAKAPLLGGNLSAYRFDAVGVSALRNSLGRHADKVDLLIDHLHSLEARRQQLPAVKELRQAIEKRLEALQMQGPHPTGSDSGEQLTARERKGSEPDGYPLEIPPMNSSVDDIEVPNLESSDNSPGATGTPEQRRESGESSSPGRASSIRINEIHRLRSRRETLLPKELAQADRVLCRVFDTEQPWRLYEGKASIDRREGRALQPDITGHGGGVRGDWDTALSLPPDTKTDQRSDPDVDRDLRSAADSLATYLKLYPSMTGERAVKAEDLLANWGVEDISPWHSTGSLDRSSAAGVKQTDTKAGASEKLSPTKPSADEARPTSGLDDKSIAMYVERGVSSSKDLKSINETIGYFRQNLKNYLSADKLGAIANRIRWTSGQDGPDPIVTMTSILASTKSEDKVRLLGTKILQSLFRKRAEESASEKDRKESKGDSLTDTSAQTPPTIEDVVKDTQQANARVRRHFQPAFEVLDKSRGALLLENAAALGSSPGTTSREQLEAVRSELLQEAGLSPPRGGEFFSGPDHMRTLKSLVRVAILAELDGKQIVAFHPDQGKDKDNILARLTTWGIDVKMFMPEIAEVLAQPLDDSTLESWRQAEAIPDRAHLADTKGKDLRDFDKEKEDLIASIEQMSMTTRVRVTRNVRGELTTGRITFDPTGTLGLSGRVAVGWPDSIELCRVGEGYEIALRRNYEVRAGVEGSAVGGVNAFLKAEARLGIEGGLARRWKTAGVSLRFANDKSGREGMQAVLRSLLDGKEPDLSKAKYIAPLDEQVINVKGSASVAAGVGYFPDDPIESKAVSAQYGVGARATAALAGSAQWTRSSTHSTVGSVEKQERIRAVERTISAGVSGPKIAASASASLVASDNLVDYGRVKSSQYRRQLKKVSGKYGETAPQTEYIQSLNLPARRRRATAEEVFGPAFKQLLNNLGKSQKADDRAMAEVINNMLDKPGPNEAFVLTSNIDPDRALEIDALQLEARNLRMGMGGYSLREAEARAVRAEARVRQILDDPSNYVIARIDLHGQVEASLSRSLPIPFVKVQQSQETRGFYVSHQVKPDPVAARQARDEALGVAAETKANPSIDSPSPPQQQQSSGNSPERTSKPLDKKEVETDFAEHYVIRPSPAKPSSDIPSPSQLPPATSPVTPISTRRTRSPVISATRPLLGARTDHSLKIHRQKPQPSSRSPAPRIVSGRSDPATVSPITGVPKRLDLDHDERSPPQKK